MLRTTKLLIAAVARLLLGLYLLASAATLHAVSPLVTDDADTVEPGKLQLNCDFFLVRTSSTSLYSVPINPVLGLTPRFELGVIFGYQWRDGSGSTPTTSDADDLTDLTVAPKVRLWQGSRGQAQVQRAPGFETADRLRPTLHLALAIRILDSSASQLTSSEKRARFQHWLLRDRHFARRLRQ